MNELDKLFINSTTGREVHCLPIPVYYSISLLLNILLGSGIKPISLFVFVFLFFF